MRRSAVARAVADYIPFQGGVDMVSPTLSVTPGMLTEQSLNFESSVYGGYEGILGYERFDGQSAPSDATYHYLTAADTSGFSVGDVVTGATSGASGEVARIADGALVLTKTSGTPYSSGENLQVSAITISTASAASVQRGAQNSQSDALAMNAAADVYRADITAVPGSGSVLGVAMLNDVKYAWRNNAGGTAAVLHKATVSGWTAVDLGRELSFNDGGTYEIQEGDTITGATSGATAVVTRVVFETGSWGGGDAEGRLIFASQTGTFQSENLDVGANLNVATIAGDSSAITLQPDGRVETINHNFGGQAGTLRMYGVDGENRAFEFDGTVYVPINTGLTTDKPTKIEAFKHHLFVSYGSSAQHSGTGTPYIWSPIFGAAELAVGRDITGFLVLTGGSSDAALAIFAQDKVHVLYGNDNSDWSLQPYTEEVGGRAFSIQDIGFPIMLDDRGLVDFQTTESFGNFQHAFISNSMQPWITSRRSTVTGSCVVRDKNQYRIFFSSGDALFVTINGNTVTGLMPVTLTDPVTCIFSQEDSSGNEIILFGSSDGFVYQAEKGTSFDGDDITRRLPLHYVNSGAPRQMKSYRGGSVEISAEGYVELTFSYSLQYGLSSVGQPAASSFPLSLATATWDSGTWDSGTWDAFSSTPLDVEIDGAAENISLIFTMESDYQLPPRLSGAQLFYLPRRRLRG